MGVSLLLFLRDRLNSLVNLKLTGVLVYFKRLL